MRLAECRCSRDGFAGQLRLDITNDLLNVGAVFQAPFKIVGVGADQQFVKNQTQGINVGGGVYWFPARLLRTEITQSAHADVGARGGVSAAPMNGIEYLGDSEIEQPRGSVFRDQDVARFQVAMHNELAVSIGNCLANIPEKLQAVLYRNLRFTAIDVNRQPVLDEVHHQISLSFLSQTGINQPHDPGVIQVGQDLPLIQKPQLQVAGMN